MKIALTYDQREDIICDMQNVTVTDWSVHPERPDVVHQIRECTAGDLLDCVLRYLEELPEPNAADADECMSVSQNCRKNNPSVTECCSLYSHYAAEGSEKK